MKSIDHHFDPSKEFGLGNLPDEVWKDIPDYEGLYQVSNLGRVKSFHSKLLKILKPCKDRYGYLYVGLSKNKTLKLFKVHRLVAFAFIPNPENKPEIDHINAIKTDNRLNNLRWATTKENIRNPLNMIRFFGEKNSFYGKKHSDESKKIMSQRHYDASGGNNPSSKKVINLDTMCIFDTVTHAAAFYGKSRKTLSGAIKDHYRCAGFYWGYYSDV